MPRDQEEFEGRFAIMIDGEASYGFVRSVSGGTIRGQLERRAFGPPNRPVKRITSSSYDNLTVETGMGAPDRLLEWVQATLTKGGYVARSGEVHACDPDLRSVMARDFFDAQITEIRFPQLDAMSKDPAFLTLEIRPSGMRYRSGLGIKIPAKRVPESSQWKSSNFRVTMGDLPCTHVSEVDSWIWKRPIKKRNTIEAQIELNNPIGGIEISNLKLTLSAQDIIPWQKYVNSFIIEGDSGPDNEVQGSIELLSMDLKHTLARLDLIDCGTVALQVSKMEANKEAIARFEVDMYVSAVAFHFERPPTIPPTN